MRYTAFFKLSVAAGVIGLLWFGAECFPAQGRETDIKAEVRYREGDTHSLSISLTNNGRTPVSLYDWTLPWHPRSILLVLVTPDAAESVIEQSDMRCGFPVAAVSEIAPGATIHGTVRLDEIYPTLHKELESSRVDVFYAFDIETTDDAPPQRVGGWLSIPRRKK